MTDAQQAELVELTIAGDIRTCDKCRLLFVKWLQDWTRCPWCAIEAFSKRSTYIGKQWVHVCQAEIDRYSWLR